MVEGDQLLSNTWDGIFELHDAFHKYLLLVHCSTTLGGIYKRHIKLSLGPFRIGLSKQMFYNG